MYGKIAMTENSAKKGSQEVTLPSAAYYNRREITSLKYRRQCKGKTYTLESIQQC